MLKFLKPTSLFVLVFKPSLQDLELIEIWFENYKFS